MNDRDRTIRLPDLGEGLTEAQVLQFLVSEGDEVERLAPVVEVETDKTIAEVTSPWNGQVQRLLVSEGDWVGVGEGLIELTTP